MSKKKSEFIVADTVSNSQYIPVFGDGADRAISKPNLFQQIKDESFSPFIYPTIELLQAADLEADDTNPTYARCEETDYRLYKITNLAAGVNDISLTNGNTATRQVEYQDIGFVVGPGSSVTGSIAVFSDTSGAQLDDLLVPTNAGKSFMQAADSASVTFPRKNADNTVSMLGASTYFDAIKQASAVGYSGTIETATATTAKAGVATDEAITPALFKDAAVFETVSDLALVSKAVGTRSTTKGCLAAGDGGHGIFITETASGTPDGYSRVLLPNGNHDVIQPLNGRIASQCLGLFATGSDETAALVRCRDFSNDFDCEVVIPAGTVMTNELTIDAKRFKLRGDRRETTVIMLNNSRNIHLVEISNGGRLYAKQITFDQNKSNQSGGHTIRSGGCDALELRDVTLKNCKGYNLGVQAGSNYGIILRDCFLTGSDEDGFDLKDYNYNNGCVILDNVEVSNFGSSNSSVGVDIRGEAQITNLRVSITGDRRGLRLRDDASSQGRAAFGTFTNIEVKGSSNTVGSALEIASSSKRFVVSNLTVNFLGSVILHADTAIGGQISTIAATDIGGDAFSFFGQDLTVNDVSVTNTGSSQRIIDFEPTAANVVINNFGFDETTAATQAVRVQSGAANLAMSNGWIRGGNIGGAGLAALTQTNIRLL